MSVNYLNSWNWIFMMSDASLMYTIFPSALRSACAWKARRTRCFIHTHLSLGSILAPSANTIPTENWTPRVTRCFSGACLFSNTPLIFNNSPVQYPLRLCPGSPRVKRLWSLFCAHQYNENQSGLTSSGLVNPRCLWAQTALWPQMCLVNCTSKEDKST